MKSKELYGLDIATQWEKILDIHVLKLAKEHHPDWYRWRLTNNFERAVFLKGDPIGGREAARYLWANQNILGTYVLEVGCSTGYGSQFFPNNINYMGVDYDPVIIDVAKEQNWGLTKWFEQGDINTYALQQYDTIVAFEVIEHLSDGLEIVEKLKKHCKRLLISVPHNEPPGFWGEHHKLHGLTESALPYFEYAYISEHGRCTTTMEPVSETNRCNLMLCRWDNE